MESLLGFQGGPNPFGAGSAVHAVFGLQKLLPQCDRLNPLASRAWALVHLAAAASIVGHGVSSRFTTSPSVDAQSDRDAALDRDPFARRVLEALKALIPASAVDLVLPPLIRLGGARMPVPAHRIRILADLTEALCARRAGEAELCLLLAAGRRDDGARWIERLPDDCIRQRARRLLATGVLIQPGRQRSSRFIGDLDDPDQALSFEPSLELVRALLAMGPHAHPVADRILPRLTGAAAQEARALRAMAAYPQFPVRAAIAGLRAVRYPAAFQRGLLGLIGRALGHGRLADADEIASLARHARQRGLAQLAIAASLGQRGERLEARTRLNRIDCPTLTLDVELARARLDLESGDVRRAARRLLAFPTSRLIEPRAPAAPTPHLDGEPSPLAGRLGAQALLLRLEISTALGDATSSTLAPTPAQWRALARDEACLIEMWRRPRLRALMHRGLAPTAPPHIQAFLRATLSAIAIAEQALEITATTPPAPAGATAREQAFLQGAFCSDATWEEARRSPSMADALGETRSFFDEGVSLSEQRLKHRTALLNAAKVALRAHLAAKTEDCAPREAAVLSRLRTLVSLGGEPAAAIIERCLASSPDAGGVYRRPLFGALLTLSPQRARAMFVDRLLAITAGGEDLRAIVEALAARRLLAPDAAEAWDRAITALGRALDRPDEAASWLADWVRAFVERWSALPGSEALRHIEQQAEVARSLSGEAFVARIEAQRSALLASNPRAFLDLLDRDPGWLPALLASDPSPAHRDAPTWDEALWRGAIRRIARDIGPVALGPIERLGSAIAEGAAAVRALLAGSAPTPKLEIPRPLGKGSRYLLRYLDKRRDFLAFLRFADCVQCCFHSGAKTYAGGMDTQARILALWKDPLSFCLRIERRDDLSLTPWGFVFGSFGLTDQGPAALLNGVYLRRQTQWLRTAIVEAIEDALCRPLGIAWIAIACRYGGAGALPASYVARAQRVHRLSALASPGGVLVSETYDDISHVTNADIVTDRLVYWKDLSPIAAP